MGLYYIVTDYVDDNGLPKVGLLRIHLSEVGQETDSYVAFTDKELGEMYLRSQYIDESCRLLSYKELIRQGHEVDKNKGTVVFETEVQIEKSLEDKSRQFLRSLVQ